MDAANNAWYSDVARGWWEGRCLERRKKEEEEMLTVTVAAAALWSGLVACFYCGKLCVYILRWKR